MSQNSGKSLVALGLADSLIKRADRVGFFRPVFDGATIADDPMARLIREHFGLTEEQVGGAVSMTDALALIAEGDTEEISARAVSAYEKVAANSDVVIVDGVYLPANALSVEFDLNVQIARDLGLPVVAIVGAQEATVEEAVTAVDVARTELLASKADLLAIIVGRSEPELRDEIEKSVKRGDANLPVYVLPEIPELNAPTVGEVAEALKLDTEGIKAEVLGRDIHGIKVAAMNVSNFLNQFVDGDFVIVPGDRADIVAATLASALAPTFPAPSGVLLTGGLDALPGKNTAVGSLIDNAPFPVLSTTKDTFKSARAVSRVRGALESGHQRKLAAAMGGWDEHVNKDELLARLEIERPASMTPLRFLHNLIETARANRRSVVLPEGYDVRILRASEIIARRDFCDLILLGNPAKIAEICQAEGIELPSSIRIIDIENNEYTEDFAATYAELRAHKGVTIEAARERMTDPSYFGTMLVYKGIADGMVSGAVHTTGQTILPALQIIKTKKGVNRVSGVFILSRGKECYLMADCAINTDMDAPTLAEVAVTTDEAAKQFGFDPKIAMLSFSTKGSAKSDSVKKVEVATYLVKESHPEIKVDGELQFDAAIDPEVAKKKAPGSEVAGNANVFIFPNLECGNIGYKIAQRLGGFTAIGPILQGLNMPVNDLSRGCTKEETYQLSLITAVQACIARDEQEK